jgi:hypothetical protein
MNSELIASSLDLFAEPPIQTSILSESFVTYNPLTTLDKCSNIQFYVPSFQNKYISLKHVYLKVLCQIVSGEKGEKYAETAPNRVENPYVCNNMLHSIFKTVNVDLNGQNVSTSSLYSYQAYFENLLNYEKSCAETRLAAEGFYLDTPSKFDDIAGLNVGAKKRMDTYYNFKVIELYGGVRSDIFKINKLLVSGVDMKITMEMQKPEFLFLMASSNETAPQLKILEATLYIKYLEISPSVLLAHHKILSVDKKVIPYYFPRNVMRHFNIPANVITQNFENVFSGQLPRKLLVAFVGNESFSGNYTKNPLELQLFKLQEIQLNINGENFPNTPLTLKSTNGQVMRSYHELYNGLNYEQKNFGLQFDSDGFQNGFGLFAFDLNPIKGYQNVINLNNESGILKINIKFEAALTAPIVMIVYAEMLSHFDINREKNVILNY